MFELKNVSKYYNSEGVLSLGLRNINLTLNKGEIVAITGDSGAGKSTLLNVICGVDNYDEGEIYFEGNETSYFNQDDLDLFRKSNVSFIFQKYNIIDSYTVLENVMLPLLIKGLSKKEAKVEALKLIKKVGLEHRLKNKGSKLSGGEKQRCVIARALALDNPVLACDEPTGNLDSKTGKEIIDLIKEVASDKLVLIVTHNYEQVKDIVTRHLVLSDGELIKDEVLKEVNLRENQEMHLEQVKIKPRVITDVSFKNIIRTPKKSVLTLMILTCVSLITLFLLSFAFKASSESNHRSNRYYNLTPENRVIVYDEAHKALNYQLNDNLVSEAFINPFYEEVPLTYTTMNRYVKNFYHTEASLNYDLKRGRKNQEINEFVLVIPYYDEILRYTDFYDLDLFLDTTINNQGERTTTNYEFKVGKVVGLAKSKSVTAPYLVGKSSLDFKNALYNEMLDLKWKNKDTEGDILVKINEELPLKSVLKVPTYLKEAFKTYGMLNDLYEAYYNFNITYTDEVIEPTLEVGKDFLEGSINPDFKDTYELSLYAKDLNNLKKDLKKNNLAYTVVNDTYVKTSHVAILKLYGFMFLIFLVMLGIFFITYAVMGRIYASKNFTYGVLRSLGMVKKDLKKVVIFETLLISLVSLVFSMLIFVILNLSIKSLDLLVHLNFVAVILFILINLLFSYFISQKFNKKIFKFSLTNDFKAGVNND